MAINVCDVCNDPCLKTIIGSSNSQELWRRTVVELFCEILTKLVPVGSGTLEEASTQVRMNSIELEAIPGADVRTVK